MQKLCLSSIMLGGCPLDLLENDESKRRCFLEKSFEDVLNVMLDRKEVKHEVGKERF